MKFYSKLIWGLLTVALAAAAFDAQAKPKKLRALIVSGQNNHNWQVSHRVLRLILDQSGIFDTDIALTPAAGGDMNEFKPDF